MASVALVAGVFGAATILSMLGVVLVSFCGQAGLPMVRLERYSHALASLAILLCGSAKVVWAVKL